MSGNRTRWVGAAVIVIACLLLVLVFVFKPGSPQAGIVSGQSPATASVIRSTLLDTRSETGTLGFGHPVDVPFVSRARSGIVTWIAPEGSVVSRGEPLFAIDGQPVILLYGDLPFFRTLRFDRGSFEDFQWFELENAEDDRRRAELNLELQRSRLAEAEVHLEDASIHVEDIQRELPATPQFIRLTQAVTAARDRLYRLEQLDASGHATSADMQQARYELAVAQAELDAGRRDRIRQLAAARTSVAEARLAVLEAERTLRDANDGLHALLSVANANADIELLRKNLAELGYEGPAAETIRRWQSDAGRSATGMIEPGQIVVSSGPVRVAEHLVGVGDIVVGGLEGQGGPVPYNNGSDLVLRYTSTDRVVTVPLEMADHAYARVGEEVVVKLPTEVEVPGVIIEVSTVFDAQGFADALIKIPAQAELGTLEAAQVDVEFVVGRRADVLAVPVAALLALPEGGFGVEIADGDVSRVVAVTTGLFARGNVEISGEDISEGLEVGVAP